MISLMQLLIVVFSIFVLVRALTNFRKRVLSKRELFFWCVVWGGAIVVVFWPGLTSGIARLLGIGRGSDAIVYASIVVLFYVAFFLYVKIEKIRKDITKLVREQALKKR